MEKFFFAQRSCGEKEGASGVNNEVGGERGEATKAVLVTRSRGPISGGGTHLYSVPNNSTNSNHLLTRCLKELVQQSKGKVRFCLSIFTNSRQVNERASVLKLFPYPGGYTLRLYCRLFFSIAQ